MKRLSLAILFILAVAAMVGTASAAPSRLMSITENLRKPVKATVDSQGNLYVSEMAEDAVRIYDRQGRYQKSIKISYPNGVAVDAAGRIYVSSEGDKRIHVYNPDLTPSHILDAADGDIRSASITIDKEGMIYVVDGPYDRIKVHGPSGSLAFTFGGTGSTNGLFNRPTGLAINEAAGEVYVTDLQKFTGANGLQDGARIQVFDKKGNFIRSFGQYGADLGQMTMPNGIAVDKAGLLYVVDTFQGAVLIFEPQAGAFNGALYDLAVPLQVPLGVAIGKNNLAYVTSNNSGSVEVYALDGYVTMETSPASLSFAGRQFGLNPSPQAVAISNTGAGTLNWTVSASQPWIIPDQSSGTTGPSSSTGLTVGADMTNLAPGTYTGAVTITSDFGQTNTIPVTLAVLPPPVLGLSNGWLTFEGKKGAEVPSQTVTVSIENIDSLAWSASSDSTWLSISLATGATTTTAAVSVNTSGMAVGTHTGHITFLAPGAIGDGSKVTVNLTVKPSTKIVVTTNLAGANFSITGPATYTGSGQSWSVEDVPPGTYAISYAAVKGYQMPQSQTLTVGDSGEIDFSGTYTVDDIPPTLALSTLADGAYTNNATLNVAGTAMDNGTVQGVTVNNSAVALNADGSFSQAVQLSLGQNMITTVATDMAENTTTETRTVVLDQTAPVITITEPADNSVTNVAAPTFAGAVDKAATVSVQVVGENPVPAAMTGNAFSLPVALPYGQNTVLVTATDLAGNVGTVKRTVIFDNANPTLAVTSPAQDITTNQPGIELQGTVADLTGAAVTVALDETVYTPVVTNGAFQQQLEFTTEKTYAVVVTAKDTAGNSTTVQRNIIYAKTPSVLTYTGAKLIAQGSPVTLSAALKVDDATTDLSGQTIVFTLGSQSCTGTTDATGNAGCTIGPEAAMLGAAAAGPATPGPATVTATYSGNSSYQPTSDSRSVIVFAFPAAGSFVIGDQNAAVGGSVTFWGPQWANVNSMSGGIAPDAFKGFAGSTSVIPPGCGGTWSAGTGGSATPPAGIPSYMAVSVAGSATKSGGAVTGNISQIVIVETNPGYGPDLQHAGTGTVVGVLCR